MSPSSRRTKRDLRPTLVFLSGDLFAVSVPLERPEVILGRALDADVRISDRKIARVHAKISVIEPEDGAEEGERQYRLSSLSERHATLLNNERVTEPELLHNGDKIALGSYILRFELHDEVDREFHHQIRRLLSHDDLTGLLSSRSFFSELRRECARANSEKRRFCVLMMDLDHFKKVNDTYGHLTGSKALEEIGAAVNHILRNGDVAARFGGEEFAAFLLDADIDEGMIAAERIRQMVDEHEFTVTPLAKARIDGAASCLPPPPSVAGQMQASINGSREKTHHITISVGVAAFPDHSTDPIELVEMADAALYRAKREGRNRVCAYTAPDGIDPGVNNSASSYSSSSLAAPVRER